MRRIAILGLLLVVTPALAREKKGSGALAREAWPARFARLAEIAKDASPPKPGTPKQRSERKASGPPGERQPALFWVR